MAVTCSAPAEPQRTQREGATSQVAFSLPIGAEETTPTKYRPSSMSYIPG
ncbi:MAG: hypothetical protein IK100_00430 [Muribaculaceae bacterium]|nr:hypothetical protein [Muribaculaceae bacterium]